MRQHVPARHVRRELLPAQSPALLQELHLLTRTGDLNADARRKLKQINHLCTLLAPLLESAFASPSPVVVDAGAGNAYLGFVLYELWFRERGELVSVEVRPDLVQRGRERAERLGFARMQFAQQAVEDFQPPQVDVVVALHACDTATDDALALAIRRGAPSVAVVPCCQAELARQLSGATAVRTPTGPLWRHPIHRREFGAQLTNVIRALVLEAHGYEVTVTELVGWEHSLKNELILGRKRQQRNPLAAEQLRRLLAEVPPVQQALLAAVGLPT